MKLSETDLQQLSKQAISAAKQAGELITSYADKNLKVLEKQAGDSLASQVLTEADLKSQALILEILEPTLKIYDLALLSEEKTDDQSRFTKDYFWCIDPLDGTLPFTEGTPGYAVSIALVTKSGDPVIGVVYDPVAGTLYHAVKDQGAHRNGELIGRATPDSRRALNDKLTFVTDRSFTKHVRFNEILAELETIASDMGLNRVELIQHGGAAMNACWVLEHASACYFKFPKPQDGGGSLWDYAATACIFTEAGAWATDIHGNPFDLNRADSTFMNHGGILYASDAELAQHVISIHKNLAD